MIEVAKKAALEAGEIIVSHRHSFHSVERKGTPDNISTEVDTLAEEKILSILKKEFPHHSYWSEDVGKQDNNSDYWWIIDPLDGTGSYSLGMPIFGVSIGLIHKGRPILGVVNLPSLEAEGSLYWATKSKGAYLNGKAIRVSKERDLEKAMVGYDFAWMGMRKKEIDTLLYPVVDKVRYPPFLACTVAGLTYVACGVYGAYIHWGYIWDFAGGAAIIEEAGGRVTDKRGNDIDWSEETMTVVTSNGVLHDELVSLIKK